MSKKYYTMQGGELIRLFPEGGDNVSETYIGEFVDQDNVEVALLAEYDFIIAMVKDTNGFYEGTIFKPGHEVVLAGSRYNGNCVMLEVDDCEYYRVADWVYGGGNVGFDSVRLYGYKIN